MNRRRVAVIGGGLGGMTAAGLLARGGCDVTLLEKTAALGGKAQSRTWGAVTLDLGPTLLTLPQWVKAVFAELGQEALTPELCELEEQCVYHFADGRRFRAHREVEATAESAAALGASEGEGVRSFYRAAEEVYRAAGEPYLEAPFEGNGRFMARVMKRGTAALRLGMGLGTLADMATRHFRTPQMQQFAGRFATYTGASPYRASAAFALIPHIERAFGSHHVRGGMGALVRALEQALERSGVQVRLNAPATWSPVRGRGYRVTTPDGEASYDAVVVNADPLAPLGRLGPNPEPLSLSGYVLLLEADARAQLPHHSVIFSADYRREFDALFAGALPQDTTLYLCHPAATDTTVAPAGKSGLFAMVNAPPLPAAGTPEGVKARAAWAEHAAALREECIRRVVELAPELRGKLRVLGERTPLDLEALGAPGGSIYGFLPHGRFGPFKRPKLRGPTPGLFFAGGGTHPGGGVPLVMRSGQFAAAMALDFLGRRAA